MAEPCWASHYLPACLSPARRPLVRAWHQEQTVARIPSSPWLTGRDTVQWVMLQSSAVQSSTLPSSAVRSSAGSQVAISKAVTKMVGSQVAISKVVAGMAGNQARRMVPTGEEAIQHRDAGETPNKCRFAGMRRTVASAAGRLFRETTPAGQRALVRP